MQSTIFETSLFGIQIAPKWYGAMYAIGFIFCYLWMRKYAHLRQKELDDLLFYVFLGVILGGRIGYVILYNLDYFLSHPIDIFKVWEGGMSFHGGLLGVILAVYLFSRKYRKSFWSIIDPLAVSIPVALGLGRIGNWINGELPGHTPYDGYFPMIVDGIPHFPSPLLQMLLEGVALFLIMLFFARKYGFFKPASQQTSKPAFFSAVFLIGYGTSRFISEFFRLPDEHIGYLLRTEWLTLGMVYTLPMIVLGILLLLRK